jgi:hypothetical protein
VCVCVSVSTKGTGIYRYIVFQYNTFQNTCIQKLLFLISYYSVSWFNKQINKPNAVVMYSLVELESDITQCAEDLFSFPPWSLGV